MFLLYQSKSRGKSNWYRDLKKKKIEAPIGSQEESETEMCPRNPCKGLMLWNNMCRSVDNTRVT